MTALIELVCRKHLQSNALGPLITRVDGRWAYCEGTASGEHEWTPIEPTRREHIGFVSQMQERKAS
jgi:hypothetical protein